MFSVLFAQIVGGQYNLDSKDVALVAISVCATLAIILVAAATFSSFRRKPSIESEIDTKISDALAGFEGKVEKRLQGLSDEVHRLNGERRVTIANLFTKFDDFKDTTDENLRAQATTMSEGFKDVHRALGKLEGMLKA
jgi:hypothetical protein